MLRKSVFYVLVSAFAVVALVLGIGTVGSATDISLGDITGTFVNADDTTNATAAPSPWFTTVAGESGTDGLWVKQSPTDPPGSSPMGYNCYKGDVAETAALVTMTVAVPNAYYDVYGLFGSYPPFGDGWAKLDAAFSGGTLVTYVPSTATLTTAYLGDTGGGSVYEAYLGNVATSSIAIDVQGKGLSDGRYTFFWGLSYEKTADIPEPSTLVLLAVGLLGLLAYAWRKRR